MSAVRTLAGEGPGPQLRRVLRDKESCFVRFRHDPQQRLWVCARMGDRVVGTPLAPDEEWVSGVL